MIMLTALQHDGLDYH